MEFAAIIAGFYPLSTSRDSIGHRRYILEAKAYNGYGRPYRIVLRSIDSKMTFRHLYFLACKPSFVYKVICIPLVRRLKFIVTRQVPIDKLALVFSLSMLLPLRPRPPGCKTNDCAHSLSPLNRFSLTTYNGG